MINLIIKLCNIHRIGRIPIWTFVGGQRKVIGITTLKNMLSMMMFKKTYPLCTIQGEFMAQLTQKPG